MVNNYSSQENLTNVLTTTAQYRSSDNEEEKQIRLVDAIQPLLKGFPREARITLSTEPIKDPWPLAVKDEQQQFKNKESSRNTAKRRRKNDDIEKYMQDLETLLGKDVPVALAQLQKKVVGNTWLSVSTDRYSIHTKEHELGRGLPWVKLGKIHEDTTRERESHVEQTPFTLHTSVYEPEQLLYRLVINEGRTGELLWCCCGKDKTKTGIHMPSRSAFLMTNLLKSQINPPQGYDQLIKFARDHPPNLVLMDPPYPNFSAKRQTSKQETYEPISDLFDLWNMKLSVQQLLKCKRVQDDDDVDGGVLVGCWVTNHAKVHRFILTKLFPEWNLHHIGQLVWIKVTQKGQLVFPIDNKQGRKPYEILLLGHTKANHRNRSALSTDLFASVPLGHSRKPAIYHLLSQLLTIPSKGGVNVYEFFARSLFPGPTAGGYWISVGNEPVLFNQKGVGYEEAEVRAAAAAPTISN